MGWYFYKPYVSVAQRKAKAVREMAKLSKKGRAVSPVTITGKKIADTFWGKAWCENLESYSDFSNRLPRGRTYVRNGSVCDLQIEPGKVTAMVCGSELYKISIDIKPLPDSQWKAIKAECAGKIGSLIELLQGRLSNEVMQIITRHGDGMFPSPREIDLDCSCPDYADMCKHVAAALYGVGARLDEQPELLFVLRQVDHLDLIQQAGDLEGITESKSSTKTIATGDLADVFGIELDSTAAGPPPKAAAPAPGVRVKARRATMSRKRGKTVDPAAVEAQAPVRRRKGVQAAHARVDAGGAAVGTIRPRRARRASKKV